MNNSKRKTIPLDIKARILIQSKRRCCLCFFWNNDNMQKEGQLAHLDRNRSNSSEDNLVYLCFRHHNQYDSRQIQGKNLSIDEVRYAREKLYEQMTDHGLSKPIFSVTIELDRDFETFTNSDQCNLLSFIKQILEKHGEVEVKQRRRGSVLITLNLNSKETQKLFDAIESGVFSSFNVVDAFIDEIVTSKDELSFTNRYLHDKRTSSDNLNERFEVVKQLTELFRFERMVYLGINLFSLILLFSSALSLMLEDKAGTAELSVLFGSSGLITYSTGRLLFMWSEALKRLVPSNNKGGSK